MAKLLSDMYRSTTWEEIEGMGEDAKITFSDFLQVMETVLSGQTTNCLPGTGETIELETVTVVVTAPGSLVKVHCIQFVGSDVSVDYHEYSKRMMFFERRENETLPCIQLDGPSKRY